MRLNIPDGGYDYPKKVEDSNYYWYPLKDSFPKRKVSADPHDFLFPFFDEPNISPAPKKNDIFRFFLVGFKQTPLVIVLTKDSIVVKKANTDEFFVKDAGRLNKIEQLHYKILLNFHGRINSFANLLSSPQSKDSLGKLYPGLFAKGYFKYLDDKAAKVPNRSFKYTTVAKSINYSTYYKIVLLINNSGYWKFPIFLNDSGESTDGFEYILEANTAKKYNFVSASSGNNKEAFNKACQVIIDIANLSEEYQVYRHFK